MKLNLQQLTACVLALTTLIGCQEGSSDSSGSGTGQSGSLAAMTIFQGELVFIDRNTIYSFQLSNKFAPELHIAERTNNNVETVSNYNDEYLMIGTNTGVLIYAKAIAVQDRERFALVSRISHLRAYDPVIAIGDTAYYTTRNGDTDFNSERTDVVGVIDIGNIESPVIESLYLDLYEPKGLGLHNNTLYVCDKKEGLVKFNVEEIANEANDLVDIDGTPVTDEQTVKGLVRQPLDNSYACNDLIVNGDTLILTSALGIQQLRIENEGLASLSEISKDG
ncbi:lvivd repeat-containing protein [Catenovulum agarivorans DS-2]|uniref:Lvivd repeat-containing protein n=1 Tax=Catenovulum agarivorans DS-2 TaxID=1328313 RepID=W7Q5R6_9ALTE|nr:hypothetical protein [Catenovulum agarivorans]EWH08119.1 lvivd repeat-containing protein [Catenovulum agarivorans DS-2]